MHALARVRLRPCPTVRPEYARDHISRRIRRRKTRHVPCSPRRHGGKRRVPARPAAARGVRPLRLFLATLGGVASASSAGSAPSFLRDVGGVLFFATYRDPGGGWQLWTSDGTPGGTVLLRDGLGLDVELVALDDRLVFSTRGGLWTSDGTPGGTILVKALPFYPNGIKSVRGGVYFSDGRGQLWKSDLTDAGTTLVRDIPPGFVFHDLTPAAITSTGDGVFFRAVDAAIGTELWRSDGTADGTMPVIDLNPTRRLGAERAPERPRHPLLQRDRRPARLRAVAQRRHGGGNRPGERHQSDGRRVADAAASGRRHHLLQRRRRHRSGAVEERRHRGRDGEGRRSQSGRRIVSERAARHRRDALLPCRRREDRRGAVEDRRHGGGHDAGGRREPDRQLRPREPAQRERPSLLHRRRRRARRGALAQRRHRRRHRPGRRPEPRGRVVSALRRERRRDALLRGRRRQRDPALDAPRVRERRRVVRHRAAAPPRIDPRRPPACPTW